MDLLKVRRKKNEQMWSDSCITIMPESYEAYMCTNSTNVLVSRYINGRNFSRFNPEEPNTYYEVFDGLPLLPRDDAQAGPVGGAPDLGVRSPFLPWSWPGKSPESFRLAHEHAGWKRKLKDHHGLDRSGFLLWRDKIITLCFTVRLNC